MRLIDAIERVIIPASDPRYEYSAGNAAEPICESLGITGIVWFNEKTDLGLRAYPIFNWCCTDEHVGLDALYLNGEPVGCSYRSARKDHYQIEWISLEHADRARQFIISNADSEAHTPSLLDPDQDIGEDFNVHYVGQALTDEGFYQGRPVKALIWYDSLGPTTEEKYRQEGRSYRQRVEYKSPKDGYVLVQDGDEQRAIPIKEFRLAFNVEPR